jgi:hypothetical protein
MFHFLRHLIGWAPSEIVKVLAGGVLVIRCTKCGKITYLE